MSPSDVKPFADTPPLRGGAQDVFYAQNNIVPLPVITQTKGIYMWDENGNKYIDASSGPVVSNIGHGNERVADAMAEQARQMDFAYSRVGLVCEALKIKKPWVCLYLNPSPTTH